MPYKLIEELKDLNKAQSEAFSNPDAHYARVQYRAKHPTEIAAFKCMDGRLHLPVVTETPFGIIQPWRNIGGVFDLGWPFFGETVKNWVNYAIGRGRKNLALLTYHFSRGDKHRGCAGFKYDTEAAKRATLALKTQFEKVFGVNHQQLYPLCLGIETDLDGFILHGHNGKSINLEEVDTGRNADSLREELANLYPDMDNIFLDDLLPLVLGNIKHIAKVRKAKRPIVEFEHCERILAVGQGFDWLHKSNYALIVGPFSSNLAEPIAVAAGIIKGNMEAGRITKSGFVLLTSATYRNPVGEERLVALERSRFYTRLALGVIEERLPELLPRVHTLSTVVDLNTRKLEDIG